MNTNEMINELFRILEILKNNGVDINKIPIRYTDGNKRNFYTLSLIKQDGINMEQIIQENNLDSSFNIGKILKLLRAKYTSKTLEKELVKKAEELGIVTIIPEEREMPIFKGGKVLQFHVDIVKENLADMMIGKINTKEIIELINKSAEKHGKTKIKDNGTIKRIVAMILEDKPEEYKKYIESLRHGIGARSPKHRPRKREFAIDEIEPYIHKVLNGEITIQAILNELGTSDETLYKDIEKYYADDKEGFEMFKKVVKRRVRNSIKTGKEVKDIREDIASYQIVSKNEFIMLSGEEQDKQIMMKIRKEQLNEELSETSKTKTAVISEEATIIRIERLKGYLRSKNSPDGKNIYFSEQDIRLMLFMYPTLINRDAKTLDEKFKTLTSFDEISFETACGMIKTFPAILGYSLIRTKSQLDLLSSENLLDYVIFKPAGFKNSLALMYALINFAKERHGTTDLSEVNISNIFMANQLLERLYKVTYDDIKKKYPLPPEMVIQEEERNDEYIINGQDLGKVGCSATIEMVDIASSVLSDIVLTNENEVGKNRC